jgi:hypothetical protein
LVGKRGGRKTYPAPWHDKTIGSNYLGERRAREEQQGCEPERDEGRHRHFGRAHAFGGLGERRGKLGLGALRADMGRGSI